MLDPYNARAPHKWANDQLSKIRIWSASYADTLTDVNETIANANVDPNDLKFGINDPEYTTNKLLYDFIFPTLPLSVQTRIDPRRLQTKQK